MVDFDFPTFARGFIAQYAEEAKHFIRSTVPDLSPRDALARPSLHFEAGLVAETVARLTRRPVLTRCWPSDAVQAAFMAAIFEQPIDSLIVVPGWHGTYAAAADGICERGLLVPGSRAGSHESRNGATYGNGIYTSQLDSLWLSLEERFITAEASVVFLCAVLVVEDVADFHRDGIVCFSSDHIVPVCCFNVRGSMRKRRRCPEALLRHIPDARGTAVASCLQLGHIMDKEEAVEDLLG